MIAIFYYVLQFFFHNFEYYQKLLKLIYFSINFECFVASIRNLTIYNFVFFFLVTVQMISLIILELKENVDSIISDTE